MRLYFGLRPFWDGRIFCLSGGSTPFGFAQGRLAGWFGELQAKRARVPAPHNPRQTACRAWRGKTVELRSEGQPGGGSPHISISLAEPLPGGPSGRDLGSNVVLTSLGFRAKLRYGRCFRSEVSFSWLLIPCPIPAGRLHRPRVRRRHQRVQVLRRTLPASSLNFSSQIWPNLPPSLRLTAGGGFPAVCRGELAFEIF